MSASGFPISPLLPELVASLGRVPRVVLEAPPGAGKTTQVPLALLAAPWLRGKVLMLEPRRIAARAAATFMARQLGESVGETVGYRIRGEHKTGPGTRVEVLTEAILTRMLQDDAELPGVGAVLFDEFHERHLHSDLGLALALEVQAELRPELRIVVMSATLDGVRLARRLDAPRLASEGRAYPVAIEYLPARAQETEPAQLRRAVLRALEQSDGDVLVFLPGKAEIERGRRMLESELAPRGIVLLPLHGELGMAEQAAVLTPPDPGARRVVLATNVAESSLTLPAVRAVVDLGLAREPRYDAASGLSRLDTVRITQASAAQRAGRAGRLAPGTCFRLWPESQRLEPATRAEIAQVELTPLALELAAWGSAELRWYEPPPAAPLAEARARLAELEAVDAAGRITAHGRALLRLGTHPRLGHAILRAPPEQRGQACDLAALLEARDPLRGEARRSDDLRERLDALRRFRRERKAPADADRKRIGRDRAGLGRVATARAGRARARRRAGFQRARRPAGARVSRAHRAPERRRRAPLPARQRARRAPAGRVEAPRRGVVVPERPALRGTRKPHLPRRPVHESFLRAQFPHAFHRETTLAFNPGTRAVEAFEQHRYGAIVLARNAVGAPRDARSAAMLLEGIAALGTDALPWTEPLRQWQLRVACLAEWCPELGLPRCDDDALAATLAEWLGPYLEGKARLSELDAGTLGDALSARLDHKQRRALDELAPVALAVPSGNTRRLEYRAGQGPLLSVKLQELFGLADTPSIAKGRVPVTLALLSPAQRPIQLTQDLRGFWERTYPEVRRELKGRYPRHPWPDDPWSAQPTARAKRRG